MLNHNLCDDDDDAGDDGDFHEPKTKGLPLRYTYEYVYKLCFRFFASAADETVHTVTN